MVHKITGEQGKKSGRERSLANLYPHQYKKGQSGNPSGRPKGSKSLKEYAKEMLASMTDEERQEFLNGISKVEIWKLAEGNPESNTDITSGGKPITLSFDQAFKK